jgi:O-antigen ligase
MILKNLQRKILYVFFFSINFEMWDPFNTEGFFSISKLVGIFYLILLLPRLNVFLNLQGIKKFLYPIFIFFSIYTIVSVINVNHISSTFLDFSLFLNIVLFWLLMNHERNDPKILEKGMFYYALGSIALSVLFKLGIGLDYMDERVTIFGDNQNVIGMRMSMSIIILFLILIQNTLEFSKLRFLLIIPIPIMFLLMIETGSRVSIISLAISFLIGIFLMKAKTISLKFLFLFFALLLGLYTLDYIIQSELIMMRLSRSFEDGDLSNRDMIWNTIVPIFQENFVFGIGKTGYEEFIILKYGAIKSPHNVIIEILSYTGVVGLFFYLVFLIRLLKKSIQFFFETGHLLQLLLFIPILGLLVSAQLLSVKIGWIVFAYIGSKMFNWLGTDSNKQ